MGIQGKAIEGKAIEWKGWGSTVRLEVTDHAALPAAARLVRQCLRDAERAADVDRPGSAVNRLPRSAGRPLRVRPVLSGLIATALDAAEQSGGAVDPTVAAATIPLRRALRRPGLVPVCSGFPIVRPHPAPGWSCVRWTERAVSLPAGVSLDLTATAKARTARLAATVVARGLGVGVLVDLGGDIATAGAHPRDCWLVRPEHVGRAAFEVPAGTALAACRAATVVDPHTGRPVTGPWSAVAVAAQDVVVAKAAAVAALVRGEGAHEYLARIGLAGYLVAADARRPAGTEGLATPRPDRGRDTLPLASPGAGQTAQALQTAGPQAS